MLKSKLSSRVWGSSAALGALLAALATGSGASAQPPEPTLPTVAELELPCAPAVTLRRAPATHEGRAGLWFDMEVARCMVPRLALLPRYARYVQLLETRLELTNDLLALRTRQVELASESAALAQSLLEDAVRARERAEARLNRAWRHPAVWAAIGSALTIVLEVVAVRTLR